MPAVGSSPRVQSPWARNTVIFLLHGYTGDAWLAARSEAPGGRLAIDAFPWTGYLVDGNSTLSGLCLSLATGLPGGGPAPVEAPRLFAALRLAGKTTAAVAGGSLTTSGVAALFSNAEPADDGTAVTALTTAGVGVLFTRRPFDAEAARASGYTVPATAADLVLNQALPAAASVPAADLTFDALVFQALHLSARNTKGFAIGVVAESGEVGTAELGAAISTTLAYARREGRTLVLVVRSTHDGQAAVYAYGPGAERLVGTLHATDVPKIVAGMAHVPFRRDFSAPYLARQAAQQR